MTQFNYEGDRLAHLSQKGRVAFEEVMPARFLLSVMFWRLFPNFLLEGGCKSLNQTRNVIDSTT